MVCGVCVRLLRIDSSSEDVSSLVCGGSEGLFVWKVLVTVCLSLCMFFGLCWRWRLSSCLCVERMSKQTDRQSVQIVSHHGYSYIVNNV